MHGQTSSNEDYTCNLKHTTTKGWGINDACMGDILGAQPSMIFKI